jgi:hypothetical protein
MLESLIGFFKRIQRLPELPIYVFIRYDAISPVEHSKTSHLPNNGKNFPRVRCFSKIEDTKDMYFHPSEKRRYYRRLKKNRSFTFSDNSLRHNNGLLDVLI